MSEQGQGASGAQLIRTADGIIGKFHQRELFTVLSIFVMLIGVLVTASSQVFGWTLFGWVFLVLVPLYVLVAMCVRAFTRKEWRVLGLSLNQVALVSSVVTGVFIVPVTLFEVFPFARFLPSGIVAGFVFALMGALGYAFFAAVAPFIAPFRAEFTAASGTTEETMAPTARRGVAPVAPAAPVRAEGTAGVAGTAPPVPHEAAPATMSNAEPAQVEPATAEPTDMALADSRVRENPQEKQMAFWFAVPEQRQIVDTVTRQPVATLEPGNWILALEDRGTSFLVSTENGETGVLQDVSDVERA